MESGNEWRTSGVSLIAFETSELWRVSRTCPKSEAQSFGDVGISGDRAGLSLACIPKKDKCGEKTGVGDGIQSHSLLDWFVSYKAVPCRQPRSCGHIKEGIEPKCRLAGATPEAFSQKEKQRYKCASPVLKRREPQNGDLTFGSKVWFPGS